jgi:hypothetical protein
MDVNFLSLVRTSKANIQNKKELIDLLRTVSPTSRRNELILDLKKYTNFHRQGNLVINLKLFDALKKDIYEYFKDRENYYDLQLDNDVERLKKILEIGNNIEVPSELSTNKISSIDDLKNKYPDIYEKYQLHKFKIFSFIEQGRILSELSKTINSLSHLYSYLNISGSAGSKRIKAYKIYCSFPTEHDFLNTLSFRCLEAFPSEYDKQKKIIELLKIETNTKFSKEYIFNLAKTIDFKEPESIINHDIILIKQVLDKKKIRSLYSKEQEKIIKYFEKIKEILIKNNLIEKGEDECL